MIAISRYIILFYLNYLFAFLYFRSYLKIIYKIINIYFISLEINLLTDQAELRFARNKVYLKMFKYLNYLLLLISNLVFPHCNYIEICKGCEKK